MQGRVVAARLVHAVVDGDSAWLLTGAVPGKTGDRWLADDPSSLPRVIDGVATFLRTLHALPVASCPFDASAGIRLAVARDRVAAELVDEDDFDTDHAGWRAAEVLAKAEVLSDAATDRVITHGDFSLGNLLLDANGVPTGCIDVGRLGVADPYQDVAILWNNLADVGTDAQRRFLHAMGIAAVDERRLAFHHCLDELF